MIPSIASSRELKDQLAALRQNLRKRSAKEPRFWLEDKKWQQFRKREINSDRARVQISGSSQPDPKALERLIKKEKVGIIVDLREEEHGFVFSRLKEVSLALTNKDNRPNPGIKPDKLLKREAADIRRLEKSGKAVYVEESDRGNRMRKFSVTGAETEEEAIHRLNGRRKPPVRYIRIAITDEMPPRPSAVDRLVEVFHTAVAEKKNIHVHCFQGHGRTTTALVLMDIMAGMTVEEAVAAEAPGGKNLMELHPGTLLKPLKIMGAAIRLALIYRFQDYWCSPAKKKMSFKEYLRKHLIDHPFLHQVVTRFRLTFDATEKN